MQNKLLFLSIIFLAAGCASTKPVQMPREEIKNSVSTGDANEAKDPFLENLLAQYPQYFDTLLKQNDQWHIRIIYTQIDRKADNTPVLTTHSFNLGSRDYFYPASTVKMPVAFLALQKLNQLNVPGLDRNTTMITEAGDESQTSVYNDPTTPDGRPTVAHYIKKIFLVSDNDAFNRLYEFLGQEYINNSLHQMGYDSAQILHRLNISLPEDQNRTTNPVKFYSPSGKIIYDQPLIKSTLTYQPRSVFLGKGYYANAELVNQPFDFSKKNRLLLSDLHSILQTVIFPESVSPKKRFALKPDDYNFLYRFMSMKPRESDFPAYDTSYQDSYVKFLLFGGKGPMDDPNIRSFNKPGDAYGFLTDVAYIVDFKNKVEFFLSATIACNSDGIFNDDHYDYDTVGKPFMANLGKIIYQYELQRVRKQVPDLSKFMINY